MSDQGHAAGARAADGHPAAHRPVLCDRRLRRAAARLGRAGLRAGCFDSAHSLPAVVDRAMFGTAHLWRYGTTAPAPGATAWTRPLQVYGSNATLAFVGASLIDKLLQLVATGPGLTLRDALAARLGRLIPEPRLASAAYSVLLLAVLGAGLWQLYRWRIFVRL